MSDEWLMTDDINKNVSKQSECQNTSLKSTGLCSCLWMDCESQLQLQQQYRVTEFGRSAECPRIPWNSAETWKFRGPRKTVVPTDMVSYAQLQFGGWSSVVHILFWSTLAVLVSRCDFFPVIFFLCRSFVRWIRPSVNIFPRHEVFSCIS